MACAAGDDSVVTIGGAHRVRLGLPPGAREGQEVVVAIRPENIQLWQLWQLATGAAADGEGLVPATVTQSTFLGNVSDYHVSLDDGTRLRAQAHPLEVFDIGQRIHVRLDGARCTVFRLEEGR